MRDLRETLELVKNDLEICDWHCRVCGRDYGMTETDIYMYVTEALNTPREDVASNNVVALRPAFASAGDAPAGISAGCIAVESRPTSDQHRVSSSDLIAYLRALAQGLEFAADKGACILAASEIERLTGELQQASNEIESRMDTRDEDR